MSVVRQQTNSINLKFDPMVGTVRSERGLSGERWQTEPQNALPLRWPNTRVEQGKLFDTWHDVAAQIVSDKGGGRFRLLSAAPKLIYWKTGVIPSTNEQWALRCGRCAVKTVTRDIDLYKCLGLFIVRYGWRQRKYDGKLVRTRVILPSLPELLKSSITLQNDENHMDTCGPDEWDVLGDNHMDHCGPEHVDHSGPGTYETYDKGEGGSDAA